jgi:hypothetical protein
MAIVELTKQESKEGRLPPVCMRCGAPATIDQHTVLYWRPWWVSLSFYPSIAFYFIPFLILDSLFGKKAGLHAPMCELHRNHWRWRLLILYGAFATSVLLFVAGMAIGFDLADRVRSVPNMGETLQTGGAVMVLFAYFGILVVAIAAPLMKRTGIHAKQISGDRIILVGVADEFGHALAEARVRWSRLTSDNRVAELQ